MQSCRDRQRRQRVVQNILAALFLELSAFEHRFCQLLDEQWHAVRPCQDLLQNLVRERLSARNALDQCCSVIPIQSRQRNGGHMRMARPVR